jgi:hypothetical protein
MRIWKYEIEIQGEIRIEMPHASEPLFIANQDDKLCMWVRVDPTLPKISRTFYIYGTGMDVPSFMHYHGSAQVGQFVWHIFERTY